MLPPHAETSISAFTEISLDGVREREKIKFKTSAADQCESKEKLHAQSKGAPNGQYITQLRARALDRSRRMLRLTRGGVRALGPRIMLIYKLPQAGAVSNQD